MKLKSILFLAAASMSVQLSAQTWVADSVEMGAGYANDVFYSVVTGNDATRPANDWHIGFQMTKFTDPMFAASIRANHNKPDVQVYSLHKQASVHFGNLTPADTVVNYGDQLLNVDTSWGMGAFTTNSGGGIFDYGWGTYDMTTHNLTGDSLYLVKAGGEFYQLWIQKYVSIGNVGYWFKAAKWDGSNAVTDSIKRVAPYTDKLFAYYNFATGTFSDREPSRGNWQIMFTQYLKDRVFGQNPAKYQNYVGVLSNINVLIAKVTGVDPNTISSSNYQAHIPAATDYTNTIGDDWKRFAGAWMLATDTSYIIMPDTANGKQEYYHLRFTRYDGTATGKIVFDTRLLAAVNVNITDAPGVSAGNFSVYPNPAQNEINIMMDAKAGHDNTILNVTDITGRTVLNMPVKLVAGINAYSVNMSSYPAGTYIVTLANSDWKASEKISVQH